MDNIILKLIDEKKYKFKNWMVKNIDYIIYTNRLSYCYTVYRIISTF